MLDRVYRGWVILLVVQFPFRVVVDVVEEVVLVLYLYYQQMVPMENKTVEEEEFDAKGKKLMMP